MKNTNRALRRQKTFNHVKKQQKIAQLHGQNTSHPLGYYKKKSAMDCGRPKCGICGNPRKSKSNKGRDNTTLQEKKSLISFFEN